MNPLLDPEYKPSNRAYIRYRDHYYYELVELSNKFIWKLYYKKSSGYVLLKEASRNFISFVDAEADVIDEVRKI